MDWANGIKEPPTHKLLTKMISKRKRLKLSMKIFLMTTVVFLKASPLECSLIQKISENPFALILHSKMKMNLSQQNFFFDWMPTSLSQLVKSEFCPLYRQKWKGWPTAITLQGSLAEWRSSVLEDMKMKI